MLGSYKELRRIMKTNGFIKSSMNSSCRCYFLDVCRTSLNIYISEMKTRFLDDSQFAAAVLFFQYCSAYNLGSDQSKLIVDVVEIDRELVTVRGQ